MIIQKISHFETKLFLKEIDISMVNSLRRIMIDEIPTMAIDLVFFEINSSLIHDEFLAHRLGLVPLFCEHANEFRYTRECDCEKFCSKCSIVFSLDVTAKEKYTNVFSSDLVLLNQGENFLTKNIIPVHDSSLINLSKTNPILLTKLHKGQRIKLIGVAKKGIGLEHTKWSPVSIIKIKKQSMISFNLNEINLLIGEKNKREMIKIFPDIFKYDNLGQKLIYSSNYENEKNFPTSSNIKNLVEFLIKKKIDPTKIIKTDSIRSSFEIYIESTGAQRPEIIFQKAIDILKKKVNIIGIHIEKLL